MKNNKGFSLVELIVVIAIMAILAAIAIPTFAIFINKANVATDIDFMNSVEYAAELACAGEAKQVKSIEVVLDKEKGTAQSIKIAIKGEGDAADAVVEVKQTGNTGDDKEFMDLIAGTIDWSYKFKTKSTDLIINEKWKNDETKDITWALDTAAAGDPEQGGEQE